MTTATRPLYWSVRRELWENRAVIIVPLAAAALMLAGFLIGALHLLRDMRAALALDPSSQGAELVGPYQVAALVVILPAILAALVYCLGALQNERRDRSILFWKSLPVSDRTAVLAKAMIPLVVVPLVSAAATLMLHAAMVLLSTAILLANGVSAAPLWTALPLPRMDLAMLYGLATLALWHAPVYLWLLLVSAWARRAAFLWAVLPPLALCAIEKIAFGTGNGFAFLVHRLGGSFPAAFAGLADADGVPSDFPHLDPLKFLATPGLWGGLAAAAAFFGAAIWLRRRRDPI